MGLLGRVIFLPGGAEEARKACIQVFLRCINRPSERPDFINVAMIQMIECGFCDQ